MTAISGGDYSTFPEIDRSVLDTHLSSRDKYFLGAKKKCSNAIIIAIVGTIATIALVIFTSPVFAIIAGLSTIALTAYFAFGSKKAKTKAQNTENFLSHYNIKKADRIAAGDTYNNSFCECAVDDITQIERFKVKLKNGDLVFIDVREIGGKYNEIGAYQDHINKVWTVGLCSLHVYQQGKREIAPG